MSWELYEVWASNENGHEELINTTKSHKEAKQLAKRALGEGFFEAWIYRETDDGDFEEIERYATN